MFKQNTFKKQIFKENSAKSRRCFFLSIFRARVSFDAFDHRTIKMLLSHLQSLIYNPQKFELNIFFRLGENPRTNDHLKIFKMSILQLWK